MEKKTQKDLNTEAMIRILNTTDKNCCEKCSDYDNDGGRYCMYPKECCHTQNTTDTGWEERFDRDWDYLESGSHSTGNLVKDFIRREIQQKGEEEYERGKESVLDIVRNLKRACETCRELGSEDDTCAEYQMTLDEILEAALETQP